MILEHEPHDGDARIQPDPEQFSIDALPGVSRGCANLMLRVLLDAMALLREPDRRDAHRRYDSPARIAYSQAQREARRWFESDRTDGPFAFVTICQALNIPEDRIRARLGLGGARLRPETAALDRPSGAPPVGRRGAAEAWRRGLVRRSATAPGSRGRALDTTSEGAGTPEGLSRTSPRPRRAAARSREGTVAERSAPAAGLRQQRRRQPEGRAIEAGILAEKDRLQPHAIAEAVDALQPIAVEA